MPIQAFAEQNCSIARTLSVLGERWTVLVLREIFLGNRRFDRIRAELGIATNVLSDRLSGLVDAGVLERRPYGERPDRFEYRLTEPGLELQPVLLELMRWGDAHMSPDGAPRVVLHTECGHVMEPRQVCSHCGGELTARNVRSSLGPGATDEDRAAEERRAA